MPLPTTIPQLLQALDSIIDECREQNNYLCLFAYLYRRVTAQVKVEIERGSFEDNVRMERFDVAFANFYIDAYQKFQAGQPCSRCWEIAFQSKAERLTFVQHILMGMNAHINLDLAVAASQVMEGQPVEAIKNDFHKINDILAGLTNEMQQKLGRVSPLLFLLDWLGKRSDERIINFSIRLAREQSWGMTQLLWGMRGSTREEQIRQLDRTVAALSQRIRQPKFGLTKFLLKLIGYFEKRDMKKVLNQLTA